MKARSYTVTRTLRSAVQLTPEEGTIAGSPGFNRPSVSTSCLQQSHFRSDPPRMAGVPLRVCFGCNLSFCALANFQKASLSIYKDAGSCSSKGMYQFDEIHSILEGGSDNISIIRTSLLQVGKSLVNLPAGNGAISPSSTLSGK